MLAIGDLQFSACVSLHPLIGIISCFREYVPSNITMGISGQMLFKMLGFISVDVGHDMWHDQGDWVGCR